MSVRTYLNLSHCGHMSVVNNNHENHNFLYSQARTGGKDPFNLFTRHIALSDWLSDAQGGLVRSLFMGSGLRKSKNRTEFMSESRNFGLPVGQVTNRDPLSPNLYMRVGTRVGTITTYYQHVSPPN